MRKAALATQSTGILLNVFGEQQSYRMDPGSGYAPGQSREYDAGAVSTPAVEYKVSGGAI
jgi:hypothetical protein